MGFIVAARMRSLQGKVAGAAAVLGLVAASAGVVVSTAGMASAGNDNPVICHATSSGSNPSVSISPSDKAKGHQKHASGEAEAGEDCETSSPVPVEEKTSGKDKACEKSGGKAKGCEDGSDDADADGADDSIDETDGATDEVDDVVTPGEVDDIDEVGGGTAGNSDSDHAGGPKKPGTEPQAGHVKRPGAKTGVHSGNNPVVLGAEKASTPKKDARSAKGPRAGQPAAVVAPASLQVAPRVAVPTTVSAGIGAGPQLTGVGPEASAALGGRLLGGGLLLLLGAAALSRGSRLTRASAS
jgi:hypothetical protein